VIAGNFNRYKAQVAGDLPLVDGVLAVRGAFVYDEHGPYRKNQFPGGKDDDDALVYAAKGSILYTPSEDLEFVLRTEWGDSEIGGPSVHATAITPSPNGLFVSPENPGGFLTFPNPALGGLSLADVFGLDLPAPVTISTDPRKPAIDGYTLYDHSSFGISGTLTWHVGGTFTIKSITSYYEHKQIADLLENDGTTIAFATNFWKQSIEEFSQ
jgi:hypothetical protein